MNERRRGPGHKGLLLLIPAAVIIAKGSRHRRAMREAGWSRAGFAGHGHRHPYRFGGGTTGQPDDFRLPPRIESMLESWHTRAHRTDEAEASTTV